MTRRDLFIASGSAVIAATLGGCSRSLPTYRYRLTVEVDTPQGPRSGSSVIEVRTVDQGQGFPGPEAGGLRSNVRGEAVAVDLPGGQTLFALLRSETSVDGAAGFAPDAYYPALTRKLGEIGKDAQWADWLRELTLQSKPAILPHWGSHPINHTPQNIYPMLVHFRDIRDPKTVEAVDPDNLAAAFGAGVQLKRIVVQITDDPVTIGIQRRFPWWDTYKDRHFDGSPTISEDPRRLTNSLTSRAFSTDIPNER